MASSGAQLGGFGNGTVGAGGITGFPIGGGLQAPGQAQGQGQPGDRTAWIQSQLQMPVGPGNRYGSGARLATSYNNRRPRSYTPS